MINKNDNWVSVKIISDKNLLFWKNQANYDQKKGTAAMGLYLSWQQGISTIYARRLIHFEHYAEDVVEIIDLTIKDVRRDALRKQTIANGILNAAVLLGYIKDDKILKQLGRDQILTYGDLNDLEIGRNRI